MDRRWDRFLRNRLSQICRGSRNAWLSSFSLDTSTNVCLSSTKRHDYRRPNIYARCHPSNWAWQRYFIRFFSFSLREYSFLVLPPLCSRCLCSFQFLQVPSMFNITDLYHHWGSTLGYSGFMGFFGIPGAGSFVWLVNVGLMHCFPTTVDVKSPFPFLSRLSGPVLELFGEKVEITHV